MRFPLAPLVVGLCCCAAAPYGTFGQTAPRDDEQNEPTAEQSAFFEKKIRPVLVAECYSCHSTLDGKKPKGGLALDSREGLRQGGESGPVIVSGEPNESLLIQALRHASAELAMPPKKKLDAQIVNDFEQWVRMGAPDPRPAARTAATATRWEPSIEEGRSHWAFQPPRGVAPPKVKNADWPRNDIDRFVLASLESAGLAPVADADRATLFRRLSLDLTGLPPTPADVQAFLADSSPTAWKSAVERLIDSPQFGEKWARHWLDVARYAESTGKTVNFNYPQAWRYRDYVIAAFNADKPYDQFIVEQLAGDLLPSDDVRNKAERTVATGFLAIGPKTLNERNGVKFELDVVDEQIDVTTQAFLGITAACARCHDHKLDPIPQTDYYALAGIFRSTETCYGTVTFINAQRKSSLLTLPDDAQVPAATGNLSDDERRRIERQIQSVRDSMQDSKDGLQRFFATGQISLLQARLDAYEADGTPKLLAMGVRDKPARSSSFGFGRGGDRGMGFAGFSFNGSRTIADSPLYARGEPDQPSDKAVPRGTLQVVSTAPLKIPSGSSGRLELAQWIASRDNPLTARVMVNRIWLQLFGRGLVPTPDDFGMAGRPPTHPELLDHLALRFMDDGWSVKKLIRYVVASHTYQLGSQANSQAREVDPDNRLLWRMTPRRLDAEVLRDSLLAVSGQLASTPPVGSVVARVGEGPVTRPRFGGDPISAAINDPRDTHRSIYLPIIRDNLPESMALFDAADPSLISSDRQQTTVPSQGLFLLNSAFVLRAADSAAERLLEKDGRAERVREAYERFLGRLPSESETAAAESFLDKYDRQLNETNVAKSRRERELWSTFCQALFASAEFQYRR